MRLKQVLRRLLPGFRAQPASSLGDSPEKLLDRLAPEFRAALLSLYRGEPQKGLDGQSHPIDIVTRISPREGMWLYDLCLSIGARKTLEIGMANGYSTLYMLAALSKQGFGDHCAIDPSQRTSWKGIGLANVAKLGMDNRFHLIADRSDRAATDLIRTKSSFDVIFVDGNHRFDDVLVDFTLYAPLCKVGSYIVLDDLWMSSIRTVAAFIRANRDDFTAIPTLEPNVLLLRKLGPDKRSWNHFRHFEMMDGAS